MSLLTLREGIINAFKDSDIGRVPGIVIQGHAGRFDAAELQRISTQTPAIHLACLNVNSIDEGHAGVSALITWGAFVTVKDKPGLPRDIGALALVDALARHVPGQRWNLDESEGRPQSITANNLYAAHIDKLGVAMWAITWQQQMTIGTEDSATLAPFLTYHAEHILADGNEPDAIDQVTLPQ